MWMKPACLEPLASPRRHVCDLEGSECLRYGQFGHFTVFCGGTGAFNINAFGVIAGAYSDNSGNYVGHGLIRLPGGRLQSYEVPHAGNGLYQGTGCPGCSIGLNIFGATAGYYVDSNSLEHVYLRSFTGHATTFNTPGTRRSELTASLIVRWASMIGAPSLESTSMPTSLAMAFCAPRMARSAASTLPGQPM